nr:periplasmic heavy metal sensor [Pacificimonas flava]
MGKWSILAIVFLALAAGALGAFLHDRYGMADQASGLHEFVHEELDLTEAQERQLDALELRYAPERSSLEKKLAAANRKLAAAIKSEHRYGPRVSLAIENVHQILGDMQKTTVDHVFAMRELLSAEQRVEFDRRVNEALTRAED